VPRSHGLPAAFQALVFVAAAWLGWTRLPLLAVGLGLAGLAQLALAVALFRGRGSRLVRPVAVLSLVVFGVLLGLLVESATFVITTFTSVGARSGWQLLGAGLGLVPWGAFIPCWQLLVGGDRTSNTFAGVAVAAILGGSAAHGVGAAGPDTVYAPVDGRAAAAWMLDRRGPPPDGEDPVHLVVTVVGGGKATWSRSIRAGSLGAGLAAVSPPPPEGPSSGILVEQVLAEGDFARPWLARGRAFPASPGEIGVRTTGGITGAWAAWRGELVGSVSLARILRVPGLKPPQDATGWVETRGWLATAEGVVALERGWAEPAPFEPDALLAAALEGGRHLAANMSEEGRFAYVVEGPSGEHGPGYNYPRHAGGAWFLARLWQRTRDPEIRDALDRSLDYLVAHTHHLPDGRAFVLDPDRRDGKAWVGTNALALLAFIAGDASRPMQEALAAHLAASVAEDGRVRGNFDLASSTWPDQPLVTYAEGQVLLGLAAAERAGLPGVRDALERAAEFIERDYWPAGAGVHVPLDEHWICLGAAAADEVLPIAAGERICRAWIQDRAAPPLDSGLAPAAGPAAATAEAWIAAAELDRRRGEVGTAQEGALRYAELLLDQAYQAADAPLVARPTRLVGGFRDRPHVLDVRVDAVQHISCALLGAEQLLRGRVLPGAMP